LLSDAFEALVAAVYLDAGFPAAREVVRRVLGAEAAALRPEGALADDAKTALQQRLQAAGCRLPAYRVVRREGPSHRPRFTVEVSCEGEPPASGEGTSRKSAEQEAARSLLARLEEREGAPQEALLGSAPGVAGRKLSTVSTIRSQEKAPRASRIAADIASPRPSRKKSTTARASAAGSDGGTRIPVSPSWTASGSPPTRVATTGFPKP
ncbi:hypothetical protein FBQ97_04375, partial [Acidobacteria bacterium ACD]|nr:hypothetical protein [Acidobacteria bacterium ACD]